jgi:hypothetical protein
LKTLARTTLLAGEHVENSCPNRCWKDLSPEGELS